MEKEQRSTFDGVRTLFEKSVRSRDINGVITLLEKNELGQSFELRIGKEKIEGLYLSAGGILVYDASPTAIKTINEAIGVPNFIYNLKRKDENKVMALLLGKYESEVYAWLNAKHTPAFKAMIMRQQEAGEVSGIREMIETPKEDDSPLETN
jgi:hypothetical protein